MALTVDSGMYFFSPYFCAILKSGLTLEADRGEGCFHRRKPFVRFRLALWRLIRNLSVARDRERKNPRSDLIPSAMLDSMTVGLNIILLDNDGPTVLITKVVVKKPS